MADALKLGGTKVTDGLEVHVDGHRKTYRIPLLNQLGMGDLMVFRRIAKLPEDEQGDAYFDAFYELCIKYVPKDAIDSLRMDEFAQFVQAWQDASDGDVTPGE